MIVFQTPILKSKNKYGNNKYWQGFVSCENDNYYTYSEFYQDTKNGQSTKKKSELYLVHGSNIGKSNEKNALEQSIFNIQSDMRLNMDKGYIDEENPIKKDSNPLPMLAKTYDKNSLKYILNPYFSPKIDGFRLLMCNGKAWSRNGKDLSSKVSHFLMNTNGDILDGELVLPDFSFQETCRSIKKYNKNTHKLEYHVFDMISDKPFRDRHQYLKDNYSNYDSIKIVESIPNTLENVEFCLESYLEMGYEGLIIREGNSPYQINTRSNYLIKHKKFIDSEFEIIDVIDGNGREFGCAIFVCITPDGETFTCRPEGSMKYRKNMFSNKIDYIGKYLTIQYQELSEDLVPRFPVGKGVRDYE